VVWFVLAMGLSDVRRDMGVPVLGSLGFEVADWLAGLIRSRSERRGGVRWAGQGVLAQRVRGEKLSGQFLGLIVMNN
jgi:hypothetical protein